MSQRPTTNRLLVIIPDRLSELVTKGEIINRYYNPGDLFEDVHILMTNDDAPSPHLLQRAVGSGGLHLHNLPAGKGVFLRSLGWRPRLLDSWAEKAVTLAQQLQPDLVRCHGASINAYAAYRIKRALGIPYVVSMHTNPDDTRRIGGRWKERVVGKFSRAIEKVALRNANLVLPVYEGIVPFLKDLGGVGYEICYNALNASSLKEKANYDLHHPVRIVSVGRQIAGKNPEFLIRAVAGLVDCHLTMIGDGSLHQSLVGLVARLGISDRVRFLKAVDNNLLCEQLADFDIFAVHNDYSGIPKAVMEPMLIGLPIVSNRNPVPVPELGPDICILVDNSAEGYTAAILRLITDDSFRARLGRTGRAYAERKWAPLAAEARFVELYRRFLPHS